MKNSEKYLRMPPAAVVMDILRVNANDLMLQDKTLSYCHMSILVGLGIVIS